MSRSVHRALALIGPALAGAALATAAAAQDSTEPPIPALLEPTFLLSTGRIVDPGDFRGEGVILGTTRELALRDQSLTAPDRVFVPRNLRSRRLEPGDVVQFYRIERRILDPWTGERLGRLLLPTGLGTVDSLGGEVARVRLTHGFLPVLIGDYARPVEAADTVPHLLAARVQAVEGPVVASQDEKAILPPFDRIFLRAPTPLALAPGQVVLLYRPGPFEDGRRLPDVAIGRAMVVRVEDRIAAAVLYETYRSDLAPGDRFRSEGPGAE
jgi:hypothetical protein